MKQCNNCSHPCTSDEEVCPECLGQEFTPIPSMNREKKVFFIKLMLITLVTVVIMSITGCNVTSAPDGEDEHIEYLQQKEDCEDKEEGKSDQCD